MEHVKLDALAVKGQIARRGLTARLVSTLIGVPEVALSRAISGPRPVPLVLVERVAKVLGCEPADLIAPGDSQPPGQAA